MAGEIIRPKDLAPRPAPVASELMVVDNSVNVGAATIKAVVEAGRPAASQAEAQAGTDASKAMTPLTTKQSIASEVGVSLASKAQGDLAATAVQPGALSTVATSGEYGDLSGLPALGTAAATDASAYATAAQGLKADSAIQSVLPGTNTTVDNTDPLNPVVSSTGGISDGNKGDVTVSGGGEDWALSDSAKGKLVGIAADRTALAAMPGSIYKSVDLMEAGRKGRFQWDGSNLSAMVTLDTQQGIYVPPASAPTGGSGAWVRVYDRVPSVRAFGAKLDGVTNDSVAIQAALKVLGEAFIPYTPAGFVAGDIDVNPALGHVIRTSKRPTWKLGAAHACAIRVLAASVAGVYAEIDAFVFDGQAAPNTSGAILMNTAAGVVFGVRIQGIIARNCGFAYREQDSASHYVVDVTIGDVLCYNTRGTQIYSRRSRGFFNWKDIKVDNTYNIPEGKPQVTWQSIYFADLIGLDFDKIDVVGDIPGVGRPYSSTAIGIVMDGGAGRGSIYGRRLLVDNTCGPGILLANLFNIEVDLIQAYQNLGPAIQLQGVSKSTMSKVKAVGGIGLVNAAAGSSGLSMTSCTSVIVSSLEAELNTGDGNIMVSCSDCVIMGGYSNSNTGWGYREFTAATRNLRIGVRALSNTAGALAQIGAQSATTNWWANGGTFIASNVGAITV